MNEMNKISEKQNQAYWWGYNQFPKCKSMYFTQKSKPNFDDKKVFIYPQKDMNVFINKKASKI